MKHQHTPYLRITGIREETVFVVVFLLVCFLFNGHPGSSDSKSLQLRTFMQEETDYSSKNMNNWTKHLKTLNCIELNWIINKNIMTMNTMKRSYNYANKSFALIINLRILNKNWSNFLVWCHVFLGGGLPSLWRIFSILWRNLTCSAYFLQPLFRLELLLCFTCEEHLLGTIESNTHVLFTSR